MSNLTEDRQNRTAKELNEAWDQICQTLASQLPEELRFISENGQEIDIANLSISEDEREAYQIEEYSDILPAIVNKANRLGGALYANMSFGVIGAVDNAPIESDISVINPDVNVGFDIPLLDNNKWSETLVENKDLIVNGGFTSWYMPPVYDTSNIAQYDLVQSYSNVKSFGNLLMTNQARLQIGNSDPNVIDIDLNSGSSSHYLDPNKVQQKKPVTQFSVLNSKSAMDNTYLLLNTGERVPLSLLPPTTLQKTLDNVISVDESESQVESRAQIVAKVFYDSTTNSISSYTKYVNNSTGYGWFDTGYLGTETADGTGYNDWYAGNGRVLCVIQFGVAKEKENSFGNGYNDWYVDESYILGKPEKDWDGFPEGITPTYKGGCSTGSTSDSSRYVEYDLIEQTNDSNQIFTTPSEYESGTLRVYWNGQRRNDFTELTSTSFSTPFVPKTNNMLLVEYLPL